MRSALFHFFDFPVDPYGFMLGLSFLAGIGFAAWRARRDDLNPHAILDLGILIIIGVVLGSRLYYALLHLEEFEGNLLNAFNPFGEGGGAQGLVMYGGLIGGILAGFIYMRLKQISFPRYADAIAPSIALGVFLTRIGCFLNGCCFGKGWGGPLAVSFPPDSPPGQFQEQVHVAGLHPSQLYESFGGLVILIVLLTVGRSWKRWDGLQFYMAILLYSGLRFMVEYTRHFEPGEMLGPFTHNQVVCIVLFAASGFLVLRSLGTEPKLAAA
ncbi:MAG: prolipoprotein diacylglyceryl transferase [Gemmatimonadetes bacterium]|nr:prolipoprotein diacylglyceryl transferase [Gemmatimonadota bacterium]NNM04698.1 prolipoprotein diacylglyceryl transferase [Gemmatimonadota bacterium]